MAQLRVIPLKIHLHPVFRDGLGGDRPHRGDEKTRLIQDVAQLISAPVFLGDREQVVKLRRAEDRQRVNLTGKAGGDELANWAVVRRSLPPIGRNVLNPSAE